MPESDNERLTRRIQVKVPDLERENPRRNDALLSAIASGTGGKYYVGIQKRDCRRSERPGRATEGPDQHRHPHRRAESPVGRDVAPLDDDRVVRLALFGVVDTTTS